jgi:hypothetical protein
MEDRRTSYESSEGRQFRFIDVYLESGTLELATREVLSAPFGRLNESTISASLSFYLANEEAAKSEMQY